MAEPAGDVLRRALHLVATHRRDAASEMALLLRGTTVLIVVEDTLWLGAVDRRIVEIAPVEQADVQVRTSRRTVLALLDGRTTLTRAIRDDEIELKGKAGALERAFRVFELFVGALLRIDEAAELRDRMERA